MNPTAEPASFAPTFWVVDLAAAPDALKNLPRDERVLRRSLLEGLPVQGGHAMAPWLLGSEGSVAGATVSRQMKALANHHPAVIGVRSDQSFDELFVRLQTRLCAEGADGEQWLLRWYDPRVFPELLTVMEAPLRASFLACADAWCYWDRDGTLRMLAAEPSANDQQLQPLVLPPPVWSHLSLVSEAGQVLAEYGQRWPEELQGLAASTCFGHALRACEAAEELQLAGLKERLQLMALALHRNELVGAGWRDKQAQLLERPQLLEAWVEALP